MFPVLKLWRFIALEILGFITSIYNAHFIPVVIMANTAMDINIFKYYSGGTQGTPFKQ